MAPASESPDSSAHPAPPSPNTSPGTVAVAAPPKRRFLIVGIVFILLMGVGAFVGGIWYVVDSLWLNRKPREQRPLFTKVDPLAPASPTPAPARVASSAAAATREAPFVNSLGMRFVPAGTSGELMSVWETRVSDFRAFAVATKLKPSGMLIPAVIRPRDRPNLLGTKFDPAASWEKPGLPQAEDHPVVGVDFETTLRFCAWLTHRDHTAGTLPPEACYALPTDEEWSAAAGPALYAWSEAWPPPAGAANLLDESTTKVLRGKGWSIIKDFNDGAIATARVGSYAANQHGLHDLSGNVGEWCFGRYRMDLNSTDMLDADARLRREVSVQGLHLLFFRGGAWDTNSPQKARTMMRMPAQSYWCSGTLGFRVVLILSPKTAADFIRRGYCAEFSQQKERALADLTRGLELDPTDMYGRFARARLHREAGRVREQQTDFAALYEHHSDVPLVVNDYAWLLATSPHDSIRNGTQAVVLALDACLATDYKNEAFIDTLAAAHAEVGDWPNAVRQQRKALELLKGAPAEKVADFQARLDLYLEQKPYRLKESADAPAP